MDGIVFDDEERYGFILLQVFIKRNRISVIREGLWETGFRGILIYKSAVALMRGARREYLMVGDIRKIVVGKTAYFAGG